MDKNNFVFVYGTLKKNNKAHGLLKGSLFVGDALTTNEYSMYKHPDLGFPFLLKEGNKNGVWGEIYLVDDSTKISLDKYEALDSGLYICDKINIKEIKHESHFKNKILANEIDVFAYFYNLKFQENQNNQLLKNFIKINFWH